MFPGFNTEIECANVRFHVQTEVMSSPDPAILTLVYKAGAIVNRVKRNYLEVLEGVPTEEELRYLAERQHRRVIEEIQAGHGEPAGGHATPPDEESLEELIVQYLNFKGASDPGRKPPTAGR